jgi:hypothetical protein
MARWSQPRWTVGPREDDLEPGKGVRCLKIIVVIPLYCFDVALFSLLFSYRFDGSYNKGGKIEDNDIWWMECSPPQSACKLR